MTWFKVDDSLPDHPKVLRLQALDGWQGALALWTLAGAWASRHLTDGAVPTAIVTRLGCSHADAQTLVDGGLWERTPDGYAFHDWTARNPTREDVESKRDKTRARVTEWRRSRAVHSGNGVTDDVTYGVSNDGSNGVSNAGGNGASNVVGNASPDPTRPDQTRPDSLTTFEQSQTRVGAHVPTHASAPVQAHASTGPRVDACESPTAAQIQTRFRALYADRFRREPYMGGGEAVTTFAARLLSTASLQGVEPLQLLTDAFTRWASQPLDAIGQNAPYAAFAGRFGSLIDAAKGGNGYGEREGLQLAQAAALKARDMDRYHSLLAEERRRFPKGES